MDTPLVQIAQVVATASNALSAGAIGVGILHATASLGRAFARSPRDALPGVAPRIALGRWLGLALEFALAADVAVSIVAPSWDEIGKLGAIVVLRTVLNYFLGREIKEALSLSSESRARDLELSTGAR